jgi:hypothetical protein
VSWGLWVNTARNPRLRVVEWPGLGVAIEVPKQIALANVALRVLVGRTGRRQAPATAAPAPAPAQRSEPRGGLAAAGPPRRRGGGRVGGSRGPRRVGACCVLSQHHSKPVAS